MAVYTVNTQLTMGLAPMGSKTSLSTYTMRQGISANGGFGVHIVPQVTGSITDLSFHVAGITTSLSNVDVGIMNVTSTGNVKRIPNNTFVTSQSASFGQTGWVDVNLSTPYSCIGGTSFYIVAKQNVSTLGHAAFRIVDTESATLYKTCYTRKHLYSTYTTGTSTWLASYETTAFGVAYKIGTKWYGTNTPYGNFYVLAANNTTDEFGFSFELDANHPDISIDAMRIGIGQFNLAGTQALKIYDSAGSLLYTFCTEGCFTANTGYYDFYFKNKTGSDVWLNSGQKYYIFNGLTGNPVNSTTRVNYLVVHDPNKMSIISDAFTANYASKISGVITEDTTKYCEFLFYINKIRYNGGAL